jgi:hypothetical protein
VIAVANISGYGVDASSVKLFSEAPSVAQLLALQCFKDTYIEGCRQTASCVKRS